MDGRPVDSLRRSDYAEASSGVGPPGAGKRPRKKMRVK